MGYLIAALAIAVYIFYIALILRLMVDMVENFARSWRPRGAVLVVVSAVNVVTDWPIRAVGRLVPPVRLGVVMLDVGVIILFFATSFVLMLLQRLTLAYS